MAYSFNRSTPDYATYGHVSGLDSLTKLTIAFYVKRPATVNSFDRIVEHIGANTTGAGSASGFSIYHNGSSTANIAASFRNNETGTFTAFASALPADSTWYAFWMVYDGTLSAASRIALWIDGSTFASTSGFDASSSIGVNDQALAIAADSSGGTNWGGTIAGLALFPGVAITDSTLITDHAAATGPLPNLSSASSYLADLDYYAELENSLNFGTGGLTATSSGSPSVVTHPYTVPASGRFWRDRKRTYLSPWLRR
jgi:hypothetical protein